MKCPYTYLSTCNEDVWMSESKVPHIPNLSSWFIIGKEILLPIQYETNDGLYLKLYGQSAL